MIEPLTLAVAGAELEDLRAGHAGPRRRLVDEPSAGGVRVRGAGDD
jgi:hypothetical protein